MADHCHCYCVIDPLRLTSLASLRRSVIDQMPVVILGVIVVDSGGAAHFPEFEPVERRPGETDEEYNERVAAYRNASTYGEAAQTVQRQAIE